MAYINEIHSMLSIFVVLVYKHLHLKIFFFPENTHFTKPSRCPINSNTSEEHVCYDDSQNCRKCNHYHAQTEVSSCNRQKCCLVVVLFLFFFHRRCKICFEMFNFLFLILNFIYLSMEHFQQLLELIRLVVIEGQRMRQKHSFL